LIRRALVLLGGIVPGWVGCTSRRIGSEATSKNERLTAAEIDDLVAFGEALVAGPAYDPTHRRYLLEHIEARTADNADQRSAYRAARKVFVHLAGQPLSTLDIHARQQIIVRHKLAGAWDSRQDQAAVSHEELQLVRRQIAADLIRGYYASPAGWQIVGYDSFPGRCGDLTTYTRGEA
jgi:hypothetical protein